MIEKDLFQKIYEVSKDTKIDVYVVGGYVRDQLLKQLFPEVYGKEKEKIEKSRVQAAIEQDIIDGGEEIKIEKINKKTDIDFVVDGSGIAFAQQFDQHMNEEGSLVEFPDFDTARYVMDDLEIEFAGARKEAYEKNSRKPQVQEATIEEDLSRRDFTVNAMAQKIEEGGILGAVIDPYSGQEDLKKKILRTPLAPDETFSEDPLRMMRAARFAAQLKFSIEEQTLQAVHDNVSRLHIISKERIQEEFFKLLDTDRPSIGLWILQKTGLFHQFLPEVPALDGVEELYGQHHKNNLNHSFLVVDNIAERTYKTVLRFAALMHDIGKPGTKKFMKGRGWTFDMHEHLGRKIVRSVGKRLRMSKEDTEYIAKLVRWHQQPIQLMDDGVTDSAVRRLVVNVGNDIDDLLKLCRSDITTGNPKKLEKRLTNYDVLEERIIEVISKDKLRAFHSPVRGEEIMETCKLKPGPTVGAIKEAIEEAILDGKINNEYEPALAYFLSIKDTYVENAKEWEKE
ncbi:MAG: HD domain-containing protein [Candidatus Magasanikbacteria bacterium]|uniref:tRNA nucleotidyltransferase n=1 Tax=Candidatus Magasanikbacteria bacterium CG10_big_fil_rev_8_21_14_0_10_38_6 TaxID=1974647 RepID=A0A2M6P038_9BACT|nr:HD domain-containing protein [Candidatus Magasanikbacteria bacterium]NCS72107.1 HD domain-containing protein [Candidatus Magasanikbacteria bacterium]PIR77095.1 MAG: tRNA nucleotidyltransferase [Candidatus Magasanikbacteria bacterium CG10_big_fil_rev_8_21_14_0_10_38_6]